MRNTFGGVQAFASQPPDPYWKTSYFYSPGAGWDVVCLCTHWVVQNTKQCPFLIHAGSVYTICVFFSFLSIFQMGYCASLHHKERMPTTVPRYLHLICQNMLCAMSVDSVCVRILWKLRQQRGFKVVLAYVTSVLVKMNMFRTRCMICILPRPSDLWAEERTISPFCSPFSWLLNSPTLLISTLEPVSGQACNPLDPPGINGPLIFPFLLRWRSFTVLSAKVAPFPY